MQKCQKCAQEFTWRTVVESLLWGYRPITCTRCQSVHVVTFLTRIGLVLFTTTIPIVLVFMRIIEMRLGYLLVLYFLWVTLTMVAAPFVARYRLRDTREADGTQR